MNEHRRLTFKKPTKYFSQKNISEYTNIMKFLNFLPLKSFSKTSALSPNEIKKLEQLSHVSSSTSLKFWSWEKQGLKRIGIFFPLGFFFFFFTSLQQKSLTKAKRRAFENWWHVCFGFYDVTFITKTLFLKQINHLGVSVFN